MAFRNKQRMNKAIMIMILLLLSKLVYGQEEAVEKPEPPAFKMFRAEENYSYLRDKETNLYETDYFDVIKFISLDKNKNVNLSLGGEIRIRLEYFNNRKWTEEDEFFYSQRLNLHANFNLGKYVRIFGELYHGLVSSEEEVTQSDQLDVHQGFIALRIPIHDTHNLDIRFGRQEMALGSARLLGLREGPNIRRTYDMGRVIYTQKSTKLEVFYGKEVKPEFGVFDNDFSLFNSSSMNPELWGLYSQFKIKKDIGNIELYYLGFRTPTSFYNDATGKDKRHTVGLRRFGKIGKSWRYNTEIIAQFGETGSKNVTAWAFETDWHYMFYKMKLQPELGLKLDVMSGDKENGDDQIQTFNPMFTNPAYFSLAATIAPVNLIEYHPSVSLKPTEKIKIYIEWASFYRFSKNDGVYSPPRFLAREGQTTDERFIGHQFGLKYEFEIDRHLSFDLDLSYFIAGDFLKNSGQAENIFHLAPTLSYKF